MIMRYTNLLFTYLLTYVANSKVRTKAVDKTSTTFINENKSVKIHEKSQISHNFTEIWKWAFFTEEGQFHGKCHGREIVN